MGAPSKEEIAAMVNAARDHGYVPGYGHRRFFRVIVALADEVERLRAERAKMLALLGSWDIGGRPVEGTRALVAKLRGAP